MPVEIHGKQYVTVAERIQAMHEAGTDSAMVISTEIVRDTDTSISIKATVTCASGTFSGHATSRYEAGGIEGQSPLEVAETSAIGRALGFAGYGVIEGIASADEVIVAQQRSDGPTVKQITLLTKLWQLYVKEMGGQGAIQEAHEASVIDQRIDVLLKPSLGDTGVVLSLAGATKAQVSEAIDTLKEMAAEDSAEDVPYE
jgi:hypothetical protein